MNNLRFIPFLLAFAFSAFGKIPNFDERRAILQEKYKSLYSMKVETLADGSKRFQKGRLFLRDGIRVLHLKGDRFEMAYQHGALLKDVIPQGIVHIASRMVENQARNTLGDRPMLVDAVTKFVHRFITDHMAKSAMASAGSSAQEPVDEAIGLSDASGIDIEQLIHALFAPEALMILANTTIDSRGTPEIVPSVGHCSDFTVWGDYTQNGEVIIGRNTDYGTNGYFDRFPTVIYFEPSEGQKYMTFVSAGMHNAGLLSYNESGLYVGAHTIPSNEVSRKGMPAFLGVTNVVRNSKSIDEAIAGFADFHPPSGWAYTVVSATEKRAVTIEISNKKMAVRESTDGMHLQTNLYHTDKMKGAYKFINRSVDEDAAARYARMRNLILGSRSAIDVKAAASILADGVDQTDGVVRSFPNTVAVHTTMTSIVLAPSQGKVFVANGTAPVSRSLFVELPLVDKFNGDLFSNQPYQVVEPVHTVTENVTRALSLLIQGKMAYEYQNDIEAAHQFFGEAATHEPSNPSLWFVHAILSLRLGRDDIAQKSLVAMLENPASPHKKHLAHYYLGRLYAKQGNKALAIQHLNKLTEGAQVDGKLKAAAVAAAKKVGRFGFMRLPHKSLQIMIQQADVLNY